MISDSQTRMHLKLSSIQLTKMELISKAQNSFNKLVSLLAETHIFHGYLVF